MATQAYRDWLADGSPWEFARPVRALGDRLAEHGYTVYFEGDTNHLTKDTPEDHTPFSATGWPGKSPYPVCMATDIMPPTAGQKSKLTGRALPSLARLAAQLRADRVSGAPGAVWIKYMNWEPGDGNCWHDRWQPDYVRTASADRGHIHVSSRSDMAAYTAADGYDLVARTEGSGMPLWGWDMSHYDGPDSRRAVTVEGFTFVTHKAGGDANDAEIADWWTLMKPLRDKALLGAYWVQYPGNPTGRADAFLSRLDSTCPGWRDGPFILQVDCEIWGGDTSTKPGKADIKAFCDRLRAKMPKLMPIVYAPKWAYGNELAGLGYPLWASAYVTGTGAASALYPGDASTKWVAYSGQTPAILQFTSSATIAGQTTCDANAYRGTFDQLVALLAPGWADDMAITPADADLIIDRLLARTANTPYDTANPTRTLKDLWRYIPSRDVVAGKVVESLAPSLDALRVAITAAVQSGDLTIQQKIDAVAAAEEQRDIDNILQLLAVLDQMRDEATDPVTVEELESALETVYGHAFSRAAAQAGGPGRHADPGRA